MTPERWKRTEEVYHAADALPPGERAAFLAEACADDEALRRDVESLLTESESDGGFPDAPALALPAHFVPDLAPTAMAGRSLGSYQLTTLLGAGGMGEVYRARDTKLGRDVAIKILPSAFTSNAERLARFEREARVLAALNHPNICAIYGLEEADGVRFLILELVQGETLAHRLADVPRSPSGGGGLPLADALTIARQVTDALEVAHEKGIIHRDLKPANIQMTPDGVAKVLDFGLAKFVGGDGSMPDLTVVAEETSSAQREGAGLGTAAYMSPEQTRGQAVDKRTDIWAFGCVLYEMLSGNVAFAGDTVSDVVARILEREPDWSALPATTPAPIRRLMLRCLAKDPRQRLRDIGDVRIEIDAIAWAGSAAPGVEAQSRSALTRATTWLPWVALVALGVAVGVRDARRPAVTRENPLAKAEFSLLTNWEGTEGGAEITPDGRFVAFLADRDGEFDIWLSQVGTGRFVNLTPDVPPLDGPRSESLLRTFGFTGDGAEVWFGLAGSAGGRKMLSPLTGGTRRAFLGDHAAAPAWSPDGTRLVYFTDGAGDRLFAADRTGGDAREIAITPLNIGDWSEGTHNHNPVWSLDGQWIYFVHGLEPTEEMDVWRVPPSGGVPERLTNEHAALNFLAPLDPRTLLYVARARDWSGPWLWVLDVERKVSRRATVGVDHYTSVAASRDGRRIVATVANPSASLWRVPVHGRPADDRVAEPYPLPMPTGRAWAPRFGGPALFYVSARGTRDGLWKVQDGQASEVWRGEGLALSEPPAVSRDGNRVAVILRKDGRRHLSVMSADGTNAHTLAAHIDIRGATGQGAADWSPEGTWIAAGGSDVQGPALFKIAVDGRAPVRLVEGSWFNPVWSPDGTLIVYTGPRVAGQAVLQGVRPDGTPVALPQVGVRPGAYRFLPDGKGLVYLPRTQSVDFWLLDLTAQVTRQLTRLGNLGALSTFDITPDGRHIVFERSRENSNVVVIDLP